MGPSKVVKNRHITSGISPINAREAAFLAVLASLKEECFAKDFLEHWQSRSHPSPADFHLAHEIAYGTIRMALALDQLAIQLSSRKKLSLKVKEKALLRTALYQYFYMGKPIYAIANETLEIAKRHCHPIFQSFLNASLRRLPDLSLKNSCGESAAELVSYYSYPLFFVEQLLSDYGLEKTKQILEAGNKPPPLMFRLREPLSFPLDCSLIHKDPPIAILNQMDQIQAVAKSPQCYIQNITPARLLWNFSRNIQSAPKKILDMCAAPGGKLLSLHDYFPSSQLFGNDINEKKLGKLKENCQKYGIQASLTCFKGEEYPSNGTFDLIVLDVPCSNTGVLNKRPEARWRLYQHQVENSHFDSARQSQIEASRSERGSSSRRGKGDEKDQFGKAVASQNRNFQLDAGINPSFLNQLEMTQKNLLTHAKQLLSPSGEIWYMTCSILKQENEQMAAWVSKELGLKILHEELYLPNEMGWDGGYACRLASN
jgi:16S rRNA (cytosine967-C5)-methyltransferase